MSNCLLPSFNQPNSTSNLIFFLIFFINQKCFEQFPKVNSTNNQWIGKLNMTLTPSGAKDRSFICSALMERLCRFSFIFLSPKKKKIVGCFTQKHYILQYTVQKNNFIFQSKNYIQLSQKAISINSGLRQKKEEKKRVFVQL